MSVNSNFDPSDVYCSEWKKIHPDFDLRSLSTKEKPTVCSECNQNKGNLKRCGGCYETAYCSNDHQRLHWKRPQRLKFCPYKIVKGDPKTVGRYVVASRYAR